MRPESANPPDHASAWIRRAESDLFIAANKLSGSMYEDHCYHAQQCVEKALKALFVAKNLRFPFTHDLTKLMSELERLGVVVPHGARQAGYLTDYAVSGRYPGFEEPVTETEWKDAVLKAGEIIGWAKSLLG